jgi:hypothetical protein
VLVFGKLASGTIAACVYNVRARPGPLREHPSEYIQFDPLSENRPGLDHLAQVRVVAKDTGYFAKRMPVTVFIDPEPNNQQLELLAKFRSEHVSSNIKNYIQQLHSGIVDTAHGPCTVLVASQTAGLLIIGGDTLFRYDIFYSDTGSEKF